MKIFKIVMMILLIVMFLGCVAGPNTMENIPNHNGNIAGFWTGLWQGLISPITFIISLFTKNIRFYEIHNSGNWYNFGFVLGAGLFLSGGIFGKKKLKSRR